MDYPCAKFGDFTFSRFIVQTEINAQNHTDADDRYTHERADQNEKET